MLKSEMAALSKRASASGDGEGMRGVVTGKHFNFNPLPPPHDILGNPLVVPNLPTHKQPKETFGSRVQRLLAQLHIGHQSAATRLRWKIQDMLPSLLASVSSSATLSPDQRAKVQRGGRQLVITTVRHPYHLRHVLDLIPNLPPELGGERRFLELIMNRVLKKYGEQMALVKGSPFSFENESREYFFASFKAERQIKKISNPDERFIMVQGIYNNYFHGRNYYYYALLRREKLAPDNKLFMLFSRACYFMARVDWNGELAEKPNPRVLPSRDLITFYLQRDKSVLARSASDPEFKRQVKGVLEAFPE